MYMLMLDPAYPEPDLIHSVLCQEEADGDTEPKGDPERAKTLAWHIR